MRKQIIALVATLTCAACLLVAQTQTKRTPPDPAAKAQHRVSYLTTVLSLTPAQQASATTIFTKSAADAAGLRTQMKAARQTLETAVQHNDTAAINSTSTTVGNLVSQLVANKATTYANFYQLLTPDQQSKFTQLVHQHRHGFGGKHWE